MFGITNTYDNYEDVYSTGTIDMNQWQHVAVVYNKTTGTAYFYKNGNPIGGGLIGSTVGTSQTIDSSQIVRIGAQSGFSYDYFDGFIDDVKIFDTVLTQSQIQDEM